MCQCLKKKNDIYMYICIDTAYICSLGNSMYIINYTRPFFPITGTKVKMDTHPAS